MTFDAPRYSLEVNEQGDQVRVFYPSAVETASYIRSSVLLEAVVAHKKIFFNASYANYDACLQGGVRLVPDNVQRQGLARDYQKMQAAGMLYGRVPTFEVMLERLARLEAEINAVA
jgi:hypothetical protein